MSHTKFVEEGKTFLAFLEAQASEAGRGQAQKDADVRENVWQAIRGYAKACGLVEIREALAAARDRQADTGQQNDNAPWGYVATLLKRIDAYDAAFDLVENHCPGTGPFGELSHVLASVFDGSKWIVCDPAPREDGAATSEGPEGTEAVAAEASLDQKFFEEGREGLRGGGDADDGLGRFTADPVPIEHLAAAMCAWHFGMAVNVTICSAQTYSCSAQTYRLDGPVGDVEVCQAETVDGSRSSISSGATRSAVACALWNYIFPSINAAVAALDGSHEMPEVRVAALGITTAPGPATYFTAVPVPIEQIAAAMLATGYGASFKVTCHRTPSGYALRVSCTPRCGRDQFDRAGIGWLCRGATLDGAIQELWKVGCDHMAELVGKPGMDGGNMVKAVDNKIMDLAGGESALARMLRLADSIKRDLQESDGSEDCPVDLIEVHHLAHLVAELDIAGAEAVLARMLRLADSIKRDQESDGSEDCDVDLVHELAQTVADEVTGLDKLVQDVLLKDSPEAFLVEDLACRVPGALEALSLYFDRTLDGSTGDWKITGLEADHLNAPIPEKDIAEEVAAYLELDPDAFGEAKARRLVMWAWYCCHRFPCLLRHFRTVDSASFYAGRPHDQRFLVLTPVSISGPFAPPEARWKERRELSHALMVSSEPQGTKPDGGAAEASPDQYTVDPVPLAQLIGAMVAHFYDMEIEVQFVTVATHEDVLRAQWNHVGPMVCARVAALDSFDLRDKAPFEKVATDAVFFKVSPVSIERLAATMLAICHGAPVRVLRQPMPGGYDLEVIGTGFPATRVGQIDQVRSALQLYGATRDETIRELWKVSYARMAELVSKPGMDGVK